MPTHRKKILVTGGSGFLGWLIVKSLSHTCDVGFTYARNHVDIPNAQAFQVDFTDTDSIETCLRHFQPDAVVHAAAMTGTGECESNRERTLAVNVMATERLLEALPDQNARVIYISTDLVFDGETPPYTEDSELNPVNHYGRSKLMAERAVQRLCDNHIILRVALMFGPTNPAGRGGFLKWMDDTMRQGQEIQLFEDEYRTPLFVEDAVEAVRRLLDDPGLYRLYHLGGPERISRLDFGLRFAAIRGYDTGLIRAIKQSAGNAGSRRAEDVSLDSTRIQQALSLELTPIDNALHTIYDR